MHVRRRGPAGSPAARPGAGGLLRGRPGGHGAGHAGGHASYGVAFGGLGRQLVPVGILQVSGVWTGVMIWLKVHLISGYQPPL